MEEGKELGVQRHQFEWGATSGGSLSSSWEPAASRGIVN